MKPFLAAIRWFPLGQLIALESSRRIAMGGGQGIRHVRSTEIFAPKNAIWSWSAKMTGSEFLRLGDGRPNMTKFTMLVSVTAISLGVQLQSVMADEVPNYDVRKSCKADL